MKTQTATEKITTRVAAGGVGGLAAMVVRTALVAGGFAVGGPVVAAAAGAAGMAVGAAVNEAVTNWISDQPA